MDATAYRFFWMPKEIEFFKKLTVKEFIEGGPKRATAKLINCIQARHRIIKPTNITNKEQRPCFICKQEVACGKNGSFMICKTCSDSTNYIVLQVCEACKNQIEVSLER